MEFSMTGILKDGTDRGAHWTERFHSLEELVSSARRTLKRIPEYKSIEANTMLGRTEISVTKKQVTKKRYDETGWISYDSEIWNKDFKGYGIN